MILSPYPTRPGCHPDTAGLCNLLAFQGVLAPHTGAPYTEAMLLGVGGGLGMGYILWEFEAHDARILVTAFRNNWQYPVKFMRNLCDRLRIPLCLKETGGEKAASGHLRGALARVRPALVWVDLAGLPYRFYPSQMSGHSWHVVTVLGVDDATGEVLVDDRSAQPFRVAGPEFAAARARIGSVKNRLMTFEAPDAPDLEQAILAGIRDCVGHLSGPSDSFSLPALQKWARLITDGKNAKGWGTVFADRRGLFGALRSLYESVAPIGPDGGSLRALYADFLDEASTVTRPALRQVAPLYRALARDWIALGDAALPASVGAFQPVRDLLAEKHEILRRCGHDGLPELRRVSSELAVRQAGLNAAIPLSDAEITRLFAELQTRLRQLHADEVAAIAALREVVR